MKSTYKLWSCARTFRHVCVSVAIGLCVVPRGVSAQAPKAPSPALPGRAEVYAAWPFDANEAVKRQDDTAKAMGIRKQMLLDLGGKVSMKFILIPAGKFMMGTPGQQHEVTIPAPYYLAVYKVTQGQYQKVMGNNPSSVKGAEFPVNSVTWKDAVDFCQKVAEKSGKKVHLPSEAQWENGCRAGANTKFFWGDDESKLGDYAWYRENMAGQMHAVGQKKPNAWGLYDINGLMWEPCRIHEADANTDVTKDTGKDYVVRGATWGSRPFMFVLGVTMSVGEDRTPGKGLDRYGFRVAMDAE